jgi:hypothetical protein
MSKLILSCAIKNKLTGATTYPEFGVDDLTPDNLSLVTQVATKWGDVNESSKPDLVAVAKALGFESTDVESFTHDGEERYLFIRKDSRGIDSTTLLSHIESLTKHSSRL